MDLNDENCVVLVQSGKHSTRGEDIFALRQTTGRSSILRQTENLPSDTVPKGMKVCFQTPRRDPVTKRILSPTKSSKMTSVDECTKALESLTLDKSNTLNKEMTEEPLGKKQEVLFNSDDEMAILSKGGYQLDYDNLDALNPFQGANKMALSPVKPVIETPSTHQTYSCNKKTLTDVLTKMESALDETLPFTASVENSLNASTGISSTDSSIVTVVKIPAVDEQGPCSAAKLDDEQGPCTAAVLEDKLCSQIPSSDTEEKSARFVEDAPLPAKGTYNFDFDNFDEVNPFQTGGSKIQNSPPACRRSPPEKDLTDVKPTEEMSVEPEIKPVVPISASTSKSDAAEPTTSPGKEGPVKLEFNFDAADEVKPKPPPKQLGVKRPLGPKAKKDKAKPQKEPQQPSDEFPVSKSSYSFDFESFDDPKFNPFGTQSSISNSPKSGVKTSPEIIKANNHEREDEPVQKEAASLAHTKESVPVSQPSSQEKTARVDASVPPEAEHMHSFSEMKSQGSLPEEEEFVPGTTFLANDFEGQMDYLEQFGSSSFQESALRKQSLYLKFDPLLRDSPKKSSGPAVQPQVPQPTALVSRFESQMAHKEISSQKEDFKLLEVDMVISAPVLHVSQTTHAEDAIIEVLKYSQKDMDAAIAIVEAKAAEREKQLVDEGQEFRKIMAEYELVITKMMADQEKEKEKLNMALMERDQVSREQSAMERSFSDLLKRLEKYKSVIEGYRKNEETLKVCAQDYLARIKKEEQRYQTLKAHAEEKIAQANEEIAEVRSKNDAVVSALQVQLRREQLKVQSLEKSLDQKEKEADELTKLCDELITKVQKG